VRRGRGTKSFPIPSTPFQSDILQREEEEKKKIARVRNSVFVLFIKKNKKTMMERKRSKE
jgi:hypothetical protein